MQFVDENNKGVKEEEITRAFYYEDFLKELILKSNIGRRALKVLKEDTYKKIYVVPTAN